MEKGIIDPLLPAGLLKAGGAAMENLLSDFPLDIPTGSMEYLLSLLSSPFLFK